MNDLNIKQTVLDVLLEDNIIDQKTFDLIRSEQINTGKSEDEIIQDRNLVDAKKLAQSKAKFYNIPFIDIKYKAVNPQALEKLPQTVASRFLAFPYDYNQKENALWVVMVDPLDIATLDFLQKKSQCRINFAFGVEEEIVQAIEEKYSQGLTGEVDKAIKEVDISSGKIVDEDSIKEVIREAPIAKIVTTILSFAVKSLASDIHIEPMEDQVRVRYRIDGILYEKLVLPKNVLEAVVSRIKILSNMKIDEKRVPQDGRFSFRVDKKAVDLRVSTLPSAFGEKVVMRILQKNANIPELIELGLRGRALRNIEDAIKATHGVVLVTGPTGSGKTTSLYSLIHKLNTSRVNIITLEDPIEYEMIGVNQVQVNPQAGLSFASGLRSILRQDPDIIMVGEIRDNETAELAVNAALTGHLVLSTLHTNSAAGAIPRLIDMDVEPFLLASAINLIVAQRVVRKICPHCKQAYKPSQEIIEDLKKQLGGMADQFNFEDLELFRGRKCDQCNDTGYKGRIGIYEVIQVTEKISRLSIEKVPASQIERAARENGMISMQLDGYLKAIEGITTIEEVLRVCNG